MMKDVDGSYVWVWLVIYDLWSPSPPPSSKHPCQTCPPTVLCQYQFAASLLFFFFICLLSVFWTTRDLLFLQTCFIQHLSCLRPPSPLTTLNVIHSLLQGYIHSFYYCSYKGCLTGRGEPIIINTYSSYRSQGCGS